MKNKTKIGLLILLVLLILLMHRIGTNRKKADFTLEQIQHYPENSMERYAYSKALENLTSMEEEKEKLEEEEKTKEIQFQTIQENVGTLETNLGTFETILNIEEKRTISKDSQEEVERSIHGWIKDEDSHWQGGGFTLNEEGGGVRISSTGQFVFYKDGIQGGKDIETVKGNKALTKVMTIQCQIHDR
ncbi:MAG: hypothetical protein Q4P28_04550 [Tissierellia bacterium]|nr:hypothetical protein [Tissierellia bacterium]